MEKGNENISKINDVLDKIRPFLLMDGGDVKFVKYENNIVYISLSGACINCEMIDVTLKDEIEFAIKDAIPSVKEVINIFN